MRLRKLLAAPCAAFLCGCVTTHTPELLVAEGRRIEFQATQPADKAAGCLARGIENAGNVWVAASRALPDGSQEVTVRAPVSAMSGLFMLFQVRPAPSGSAVTAWVKPGFSDQIEGLVAKAATGC